LIDR
jgi:hypothetical protein